MSITLDTLQNLYENTGKLATGLDNLLNETHEIIAKGEIPEFAPSVIIARIEYNQGYRTGLFQAIHLLSQEKN
jgi:hypothetical protein